MNIIGISGLKQSGKDTAAQYLVKNFGFTRVAFADPIKDQMYILNPWVKTNDEHTSLRLASVVDAAGWDRAKEEYLEIRRLLQIYGTEVARDSFGADIWVNSAFRQIQSKNLKNIVITDVRFQNEIEAIRKYGGKLIKIKSNRTITNDDHVSEQDLPDSKFDSIVINNGTIEDLYISVEKLAHDWTSTW